MDISAQDEDEDEEEQIEVVKWVQVAHLPMRHDPKHNGDGTGTTLGSKMSDEKINALKPIIVKWEPQSSRKKQFPTTYFNFKGRDWNSLEKQKSCSEFALTEEDALRGKWSKDDCCEADVNEKTNICNFGRAYCNNEAKSAFAWGPGDCINGPVAGYAVKSESENVVVKVFVTSGRIELQPQGWHVGWQLVAQKHKPLLPDATLAAGDGKGFEKQSKMSDAEINKFTFNLVKMVPEDANYPTIYFNFGNGRKWRSNTLVSGCTDYAETEDQAVSKKWKSESTTCCELQVCNFGRGHCSDNIKTAYSFGDDCDGESIVGNSGFQKGNALFFINRVKWLPVAWLVKMWNVGPDSAGDGLGLVEDSKMSDIAINQLKFNIVKFEPVGLGNTLYFNFKGLTWDSQAERDNTEYALRLEDALDGRWAKNAVCNKFPVCNFGRAHCYAEVHSSYAWGNFGKQCNMGTTIGDKGVKFGGVRIYVNHDW